VREHFWAGLDYQDKLARFLENHDEPRAAVTFPPEMHQAAAVVTYLSPGLRFFHQGQFEARKKRISPHLVRAPSEPIDAQVAEFYERLLAVLREPTVRDGQWQLLECAPAWDGNWTDRLRDSTYDRAGDELKSCGLYVDLPAWHTHVFSFERLPLPAPSDRAASDVADATALSHPSSDEISTASRPPRTPVGVS
jgi:hypothetical protein